MQDKYDELHRHFCEIADLIEANRSEDDGVELALATVHLVKAKNWFRLAWGKIEEKNNV